MQRSVVMEIPKQPRDKDGTIMMMKSGARCGGGEQNHGGQQPATI